VKKILLINGHPDKESYCHSLAKAYENGVKSTGSEFKYISIVDLKFNPNLEYGYRKRTELEPDLVEAWDKILWADHLVWVYPVWWASYPAIMKGFIDRLFLPTMAFKKRENSLLADGLLKGKTARIISTLDQPVWFYCLVNHRPSHWALSRNTLHFCGVRKIKTTTFGPIRLSKQHWRERNIQYVEELGKHLR